MQATQARFDSLATAGWKRRELPGFAGLIGPIWARKEGPVWAYGLLATDAHLNPAGVVHGGLLATLVDHAMSAIAWEAIGRRPCVTVQLDAQFLSAARGGDFLEARGRVVRCATSLLFVQGGIVVDGAEIVSASGVMKVLGRASQDGAGRVAEPGPGEIGRSGIGTRRER